MINVRLIYRKQGINYSIERVFDTIYLSLANKLAIDKLSVNYYRVNFKSILQNILFCNLNKGAGINHVTGDIHYVVFGLPRKRTILTIHDMVSVHNNKGIKRFFIWLIWFYLPCKWVNKITCVSEATKFDLIKIARCNSKKITIIPNPISDDFKFTPRKFNQIRPVILHIGTRNNKNLEKVIEVLEGISCHLRIIGEITEHQLEILNKHKIDYSNAIKLNNTEIIKEYLLSDIVSFPSTFEGFGMPIIEAQATGRVVLTSNIEPMKTIANNGALLVDPYDVNSLRKGFLDLINNNIFRENLIIEGLKNIQQFYSGSICEKYIQVYEKLYKK